MSKRGNGSGKPRRRGASPNPKPTPDPFNNGQIPACRELLTAIQDVFPELRPSAQSQVQQIQSQSQSQSTDTASDFGKLLRWHYLEKRKAKMVPPPPPLTSGDQNGSETGGGPASARKKKKRKKKKKAAAQENGNLAIEQQEVQQKAIAIASSSSEAATNHAQGKVPSRQGSIRLASATASGRSSSGGSLADADAREAMNSSSYFFDQIQPQNSTQEFLSPTQFIKQIQPENPLPGLPNLEAEEDSQDPSSSHHEEDALFSPMQFLEQMPSQPTKGRPSLEFGDDVDTDGKEHEKGETSPSTPKSRSSPGSSATAGTPSKSASEKFSGIHSPTHEWVPEETGESLQERPPGDAIKDPLTLPYLLTFSEDLGATTTTTIDGSLVSAAPPTYREPTRFETTKDLFEEWLGQLNHDPSQGARDFKKDYQSFVDFLQARLRGQAHQVGIEFGKLQKACSNIASYPCRQTATAEVEKLRTSPQIVLDASCLQDESKARTVMTVDAAFDYVALEEGHHTPLKKPKEDVDLTRSLSFVLSEPNAKAPAGPQYLYFRELSAKHLDTLADEWLLCGIEEDVMVTTVIQDGNDSCRNGIVVLSAPELQQIQKRVSLKERNFKLGLKYVESSKEALYHQMDQKTAFANPSELLNIDFNSFPQLQRCDRQCMELMDACVEVLKTMSRDKTHALADLQMKFWSSCLVALNKVLKAANTYYSKIELRADQNGSLPKMFVSADLRELYRELLIEKRRAWTDVSDTYDRVMSIRALREYSARTSWCELKSNSRKKMDKLDEDCFELLQHLVNWTDSIVARCMGDIYKERVGQTVRVLELLQNVVEPLAKEYATVERFFSTERNVYFANLRSQIVLVRSVKKQMRLLDQNEVECMVMGLLLIWRQTRMMQSRMIKSQTIPPLPLQLKKWMLQEDLLGLDDWNDDLDSTPIPINRHLQNPFGSGGKRRVMCVLAGLVYQWLGDRYKEWQAEIAEQELLTDFMAESGRSQAEKANGESKSSKKRRKKKKKGAASPPSNALNQNSSTASTQCEVKAGSGDDSFTKSVDGSFNEAETGAAPGETQVTNFATEEAAPGELQVTNPVPEESANLCPDKEAEESEEDFQEEGVPFSDIDSYPSAVCVRGDTDMSAEDFLVARLKELLACDKVVIL